MTCCESVIWNSHLSNYLMYKAYDFDVLWTIETALWKDELENPIAELAILNVTLSTTNFLFRLALMGLNFSNGSCRVLLFWLAWSHCYQKCGQWHVFFCYWVSLPQNLEWRPYPHGCSWIIISWMHNMSCWLDSLNRCIEQKITLTTICNFFLSTTRMISDWEKT